MKDVKYQTGTAQGWLNSASTDTDDLNTIIGATLNCNHAWESFPWERCPTTVGEAEDFAEEWFMGFCEKCPYMIDGDCRY